MDDTVPRRHSYPRIDTLQDFDLTNPSAIDLHEIHPDGIEGLNPETTSYRLDRGAGSNDGEVARPSLSDFNKDLDNIQSRMRAHEADSQTWPPSDAGLNRSSEDESYQSHDLTALQLPSLIEGIAATHIHPPSSTTNETGPTPSSNTILPSASSNMIEPSPSLSLSRSRDLPYHAAPQANHRAPPFTLPTSSDDTQAAAHNDAVAPPTSTQGQTSTIKIRNPRRTRRFMRWMRKKFTPPWSLAAPHDPSHGKNAAKRAVDQGL